MKSKSFEDVELWRKAHAWVLAVYKFTELFPRHELFGLTSQLRRAAVSVRRTLLRVLKSAVVRIRSVSTTSLRAL